MSDIEKKAGRLKVVAVDDSSIIVTRIESMLLELPHMHFSGHAANVSDALDLIQKESPDVVILDIHLQGTSDKNGIDLLTMLRETHPDVKIVMLTNLAGVQYRNTCLALGAEYFLDKSAEFEHLSERLKKISES